MSPAEPDYEDAHGVWYCGPHKFPLVGGKNGYCTKCGEDAAKKPTRLEKLEHAAFLLSVLVDEIEDPDWDYNYMFEHQEGLFREIKQTLQDLGRDPRENGYDKANSSRYGRHPCRPNKDMA
jgi:hypothetical protein